MTEKRLSLTVASLCLLLWAMTTACGPDAGGSLDEAFHTAEEALLPFAPPPRLLLSDTVLDAALQDMLDAYVGQLHVAYHAYFSRPYREGNVGSRLVANLAAEVASRSVKRKGDGSATAVFFGQINISLPFEVCRVEHRLSFMARSWPSSSPLRYSVTTCQRQVEERTFTLSQECSPRFGKDPVFDCHAKVIPGFSPQNLAIDVPPIRDLSRLLGQKLSASPASGAPAPEHHQLKIGKVPVAQPSRCTLRSKPRQVHLPALDF